MINNSLTLSNVTFSFPSTTSICNSPLEVYTSIINDLYGLHRLAGHIGLVTLYDLRETARDGDITEMARVDYILQKKTKEQLSTIVQQKDYKRKKANEILHIYELLNVTMIDFFKKLLNSKLKSVELFNSIINIQREFITLKNYCNDQLRIISISYNQAVPAIVFKNHQWDIKNSKFEGYSEEKKNMQKKKVSLGAAAEE